MSIALGCDCLRKSYDGTRGIVCRVSAMLTTTQEEVAQLDEDLAQLEAISCDLAAKLVANSDCMPQPRPIA